VVRPVRLSASVTAVVAAVGAFALGIVPVAAASPSQHMAINCAEASAMCTEVANSWDVFGHYVGHDEPSALFYSNVPGSGNHMSYDVTLPTDPSARNPTAAGKSYAFELSGADWFGMALCDTQSYPEQLSTCTPDSDSNIVDPAVSPVHAGEAFMEMQFYPPGWVPWPTWAVAVGASSCDPTHWCAALNIDSLSLNPLTGQQNNAACENLVGEEYLNFAFITKNGVAQAPANPVDSTLTTFTPDQSKDLFMNSGDRLRVAFTDTPNGVQVTIYDRSTHQFGSMTASAANGFAQVKYDPTGTGCTAIPYDFHPMYSTSSPATRVTWAAHSYNIAFDSEIGHFQFCNGPVAIPATPFGIDSNGNVTTCPAGDTEGAGAAAQPADGDDAFCFPAQEALLDKVAGCTFTNTGFDGVSYQPVWPDGNTRLHPTPFQFASPETGRNYNVQYQQAALEADLPDIEGNPPACNRTTGANCTLIPVTDDGQPAAFYPFYSTTWDHGCVWQFGNNIPGQITNFGGNAQWGNLLQLAYTKKGGGVNLEYNDFRNIFRGNPCVQGRHGNH
jgi:hypothetical protein